MQKWQVQLTLLGASVCAVLAVVLQGAGRWTLGVVCVALAGWAIHLWRTKPKTIPESLAPQWKELAAKFDEISRREMNRRPRPMAMWGSGSVGAGEWWNISYDEKHECEALCKLAGAMLLKSSKIAPRLSEKIRTRTDDAWKWLYYLKENSKGFKMTTTGESTANRFSVKTKGGRIDDLVSCLI